MECPRFSPVTVVTLAFYYVLFLLGGWVLLLAVYFGVLLTSGGALGLCWLAKSPLISDDASEEQPIYEHQLAG